MQLDPDVRAIIDELDARLAREGEEMRSGAPFDVDKFSLAAGPDTASFLNLLARALRAQRIVEVGTSIGYTALFLGEAARATGGRVIGVEAVESKHRQAVDHVARAGLADVVDIRLGDAKELVREVEGPIDLAFIDAWKNDYIDYFDALLPKMRVGGVVVADNMTFPPAFADEARRYQEHVRARADVRSHLIAIGSGEEMTVRVE